MPVQPPVVFGRALFDEMAAEARRSPRRRAHRSFHPDDAFPAHPLLIAAEPDSYVCPHRHPQAHKDETVIVLRGRFGLLLFDAQGRITRREALGDGCALSGANIAAGTFHSFVCLAPGSVVMEAKAGPFDAATDKEWGPWAPREGAAGATEYLESLRGHFA